MAWVFDPMTGEIRFERLPTEGDICTRFVYRLKIVHPAIMVLHDDSCVRIVNGPSNQQTTLTSGQLDIGL